MMALRTTPMMILLAMGLLISGNWGETQNILHLSTAESSRSALATTMPPSIMSDTNIKYVRNSRSSRAIYTDLTEARLEFYSSAFSGLQNDAAIQTVELYQEIQREVDARNDSLLNPLREHISGFVDAIEYMSEGESCNAFQTTPVTSGWSDWLSESDNSRSNLFALIEAEQGEWEDQRFSRLTTVLDREVQLLSSLLTGPYTNTYRAVVKGSLPCQVAQYVNGIFRFMEADKALLQDLSDAIENYAINPIFHWSGKIVYKQTATDVEEPVGEDVKLVLRHTDSGQIIRRGSVDAEGKFSIEVPLDNMPLGSYAIETNIAGAKIAEGITSFDLSENARQRGVYHDDLYYVVHPDFEAMPTLSEGIVAIETDEGDQEQAHVTVKSVRQLRVDQPGYITVRITTNDFVEGNDHPGRLPNIIHGKVILATDEQAKVDRGGRLLDVAMVPDEWVSYWAPGNMNLIQMFNKAIKVFLGGHAGTGLDLVSTLFDRIRDSILGTYLLGQPARMMAPVFLDENRHDIWAMSWSFSRVFYLVQNYTNGVRVTFPIGFETAGTHELKFYTGFFLSPPSGLMDLAPPFGVILGNNTAKRVGLLFSEAINVEAR